MSHSRLPVMGYIPPPPPVREPADGRYKMYELPFPPSMLEQVRVCPYCKSKTTPLVNCMNCGAPDREEPVRIHVVGERMGFDISGGTLSTGPR